MLTDNNGAPLFGPDVYLVMWGDGKFQEKRRGNCFPSTAQLYFVRELLTQCNQSITHGGIWNGVLVDVGTMLDPETTLYTPLPRVIRLGWFDPDGDMTVAIDIEEPISVLYKTGFEYWVNQCEKGWIKHLAMLQDADIRPDDTIKLAQGQRSADPTVEAPLL